MERQPVGVKNADSSLLTKHLLWCPIDADRCIIVQLASHCDQTKSSLDTGYFIPTYGSTIVLYRVSSQSVTVNNHM